MGEIDFEDIWSEALEDESMIVADFQAAGLSRDEAVVEMLILSANE